jgi:hypothetical protein
MQERRLQQVIELSFPLKRFSSATYFTQRLGISFAKTFLFVTTESVSTDKLVVSEEAVRVLNQRE